jgi:tetratricopeptide (TPR) repeat protein
MPDEPPNEPTASGSQHGEDLAQNRERRSRPRTLTPEQRRFLGRPRPLHERAKGEKNLGEELFTQEQSAPIPEPREGSELPKQRVVAAPPKEREKAEPASAEQKVKPHGPARVVDKNSSRAIEMQHAALAIGAILVLCFAFYVGRRFDYWRYVLMTKTKPKLMEEAVDKFPNSSADQLLEQALAAEHRGDWHDAIERFIAAKRKNLSYRGILCHAARLAYGKGDFDGADKLFERAIAFHENVDAANFYRGLIATRHRNLPAAERSFEAAATADPFTADYYYYWAEALRLDNHPQEAIPRYEQAERRARGEQDALVCQFKKRMARLEVGETDKLKVEIEDQGKAGPLSLPWLLTSAAVAVREGRIPDAARQIGDARTLSQTTSTGSGVFASCGGDRIFQDTCGEHVELADICHPKGR